MRVAIVVMLLLVVGGCAGKVDPRQRCENKQCTYQAPGD